MNVHVHIKCMKSNDKYLLYLKHCYKRRGNSNKDFPLYPFLVQTFTAEDIFSCLQIAWTNFEIAPDALPTAINLLAVTIFRIQYELNLHLNQLQMSRLCFAWIYFKITNEMWNCTQIFFENEQFWCFYRKKRRFVQFLCSFIFIACN